MISTILSDWLVVKERYGFVEEEHPRDENGQFASNPGNQEANDNDTQEEEGTSDNQPESYKIPPLKDTDFDWYEGAIQSIAELPIINEDEKKNIIENLRSNLEWGDDLREVIKSYSQSDVNGWLFDNTEAMIPTSDLSDPLPWEEDETAPDGYRTDTEPAERAMTWLESLPPNPSVEKMKAALSKYRNAMTTIADAGQSPYDVEAERIDKATESLEEDYEAEILKADPSVKRLNQLEKEIHSMMDKRDNIKLPTSDDLYEEARDAYESALERHWPKISQSVTKPIAKEVHRALKEEGAQSEKSYAQAIKNLTKKLLEEPWSSDDETWEIYDVIHNGDLNEEALSGLGDSAYERAIKSAVFDRIPDDERQAAISANTPEETLRAIGIEPDDAISEKLVRSRFTEYIQDSGRFATSALEKDKSSNPELRDAFDQYDELREQGVLSSEDYFYPAVPKHLDVINHLQKNNPDFAEIAKEHAELFSESNRGNEETRKRIENLEDKANGIVEAYKEEIETIMDTVTDWKESNESSDEIARIHSLAGVVKILLGLDDDARMIAGVPLRKAPKR